MAGLELPAAEEEGCSMVKRRMAVAASEAHNISIFDSGFGESDFFGVKERL